MRVKRYTSTVLMTVVCALLVTSLVACGGDEASSRESEFVFANTLPPRNFDPILNDTGDTFRVLSQMFETLISHEVGTARLAPGLAEDWEIADEGKSITFFLRRNVVFHDGSSFNAEAVCYNFDRWFQMSSADAQTNMYYYGYVFAGFKQNLVEGLSSSLYQSCEVRDEHTATLRLHSYTSALPAALTLPAFAISSPQALRRYNADTVTMEGTGDDAKYVFSDYANAHPTGTGPFRFESYDLESGTVTMTRFDDYWGQNAKLGRLVFEAISDPAERKNKLLEGEIDAYDFPTPESYAELEQAGSTVHIRPAFNILYLGINQTNVGKLADVRVRKAIAHAINRERLVERLLPKGSSPATQFLPDLVSGYADDLKGYEYDPERARKLLDTANATNLTLRFYYPLNVSRPYMPNPSDIFSAISDDLKAVGFAVEGIGEEWSQYLTSVREDGKHDLHLLGWTGDYNAAGNFIGSFFSGEKPEFGYDEPAMFSAIASADALPDPKAQSDAYKKVSRSLMEAWLPAVPLTHSPSALAAAPDVRGLAISPMTDERFASVYKAS